MHEAYFWMRTKRLRRCTVHALVPPCMLSTGSSLGLGMTGTSGTHRWTFHVEKKRNHDRHMSKRQHVSQLSHVFPQCLRCFIGAWNLMVLLCAMRLSNISRSHVRLTDSRAFGLKKIFVLYANSVFFIPIAQQILTYTDYNYCKYSCVPTIHVSDPKNMCVCKFHSGAKKMYQYLIVSNW